LEQTLFRYVTLTSLSLSSKNCPKTQQRQFSTTFVMATYVIAKAQAFIDFVNKSPSPYHAVAECKSRLLTAGFVELNESSSWSLRPGGQYLVTRNGSALIAFAVGGAFKPGNGFSIIGAHTDSPCLKLKPVSKTKDKEGYIQVGVQCYGGGLWHTWFDRDLRVGGSVIVKTKEGNLEQRLVDLNQPLLRVPNLAIHLNTDRTNFAPNKETHLCPVLATAVQHEIHRPTSDAPTLPEGSQASKHHPILVKLICDQLCIEPEQMLDFELSLADAAPAVIGGAYQEFLFAPRLDNLLSTYTATIALIESCQDESLACDENVRIVSLFDNEEVGSQSAQGAESMLQEHLLRRITNSDFGVPKPSDAFETAIAKSLMISADMAHAVHPNYSDKHEDCHKPGLHKGIVVKTNTNQRYATTSITTAILRQVAEKAAVPLQDFVVKNDSPCGSTIGPIMSARLGMATVDVGAPQLSMHSIREMGCTSSVAHCIKLFGAFFSNFAALRKSCKF